MGGATTLDVTKTAGNVPTGSMRKVPKSDEDIDEWIEEVATTEFFRETLQRHFRSLGIW